MKRSFWALLAVLMCLAATALADNGFTVMRFPEDFTVGEVTHQPRPALFSMGEEGLFPEDLLYGDAIANGLIPPADAGRLKATAQKGLKADINISTGLIEVDIDMANSNWTEVMANGDLYPKVMVRHTLDRPDTKYETHAGFSGGFEDKTMGYIMTLMEETGMHWDGGNIQAGNGEMIAEIIPAQSLLTVDNRVMTSNHFIAWMDADTREVYYEHYKMIVTLSDTQNRYVPFRYVSESMLKPTETAALPSGVTVKEIKDGDVTFKVTGGGDNYDAPIVLKAPEGAAAVEIYGQGSVRPSTFANGKATFIFSFNGTDTHESQYNVKWYNSANEIIEYGILLCHAEPEDYGPWPSYSTTWAKPDSDRVVLINGSTDIGVTLTYDNQKSVAHIGYDKDAAVTGDVGTVYVLLEAPEGATHFRMNESGANDIMGEDENEVQTQLSFTREQELQQVPESGFLKLVDRAPLRKIEADPLEVFVQIGEGEVWPYSGSVFTVFWYESEEDALLNPGAPAAKEYVALTTGSMCTTNRVDVVEKEEDITQPVEEVTAVGREYNSQGWRLVVKRYPFKGREGFHYELTLENRYGVYEPLTEKMVFYMPYPNDYFSHPDNYTFGLRHFESDYSDYELVNVTQAEYGVRFEIASLSPFVLSWNNGEGSGGEADDKIEGIVVTNQGVLEAMGRVDKPVIVVDPALVTANGPLRLLYSKTDDAENQVNYNLRLVNENGAAVTFSEAHLCLPYPGKMDEETSVGMAPVVTHEAGSGNEVFTIEDNTLGHPVQGLCMDIDSLGLYEVAWQGGESGNPPADDWNSGVIVASVNEINGPVEHPTIVLSDDFVQANDAQFVYREAGRDFDRVIYEVRLMNSNQSDVDLTGETTLYLPYPEELNESNARELAAAVTHDGGENTQIYDLENGALTCDGFGMKMQVSALVMFEISWAAENPNPGPGWDEGCILHSADELANMDILDKPAIILPASMTPDNAHLLYSLVGEDYNFQTYEIRLVDNNENDIDLPGETPLYLPYAASIGMDVNNYADLMTTISQADRSDPPEPIPLAFTAVEQGMGVNVTFLGIFDINWDVGEHGGGSGGEGMIVTTEAELDQMGPVEVPTLVLPEDFLADAVPHLVYEFQQENATVWSYLLRLLDANDGDIPLPGESLLCLPYPGGMDEYNCADLRTAVHHPAGEEDIVFDTRNGLLTPSPQGLRIRVSDLELFAIVWQGYEPPADQKGQILEDVSLLERLAPVKVPTIILPPGFAEATGAKLVFENLPSDAPNVVHYEVTLVDLMGSPLELPCEALLCFPYPEGISEVNSAEYRITIYHGLERGVETFSTENSTLEPTRQGLCIWVTELSPFEIIFEKRDLEIPQTGDAAPIEWYGLMLGAGALVLAAQWRRRRERTE